MKIKSTIMQELDDRHHNALHLAHRWFAFLEAPVGNMATHLSIFHPKIQLSGHRGLHLFAHDHQSLEAWFSGISDVISSHHIVHSNYLTAENGEGLLNMVVAYQSPANSGVHGSIISYETRIEFCTKGARFISLDKTPILANTRLEYETSWAANRVLARVHAELAGITGSDGQLRTILGEKVRQIVVHTNASEASRAYQVLVSCNSGDPVKSQVLQLTLSDDGASNLPTIIQMEVLRN